MDIGATICRPRSPDCAACPLESRLRGVPLRRAGDLSAEGQAEGQAAARGRGLLRAPGGRRLPRPPAAAEGAARLDRRTPRHALDERRAGRVLVGRRAARGPLAPLARAGRAGLHPFRAESRRLRGALTKAARPTAISGSSGRRSARPGSPMSCARRSRMRSTPAAAAAPPRRHKTVGLGCSPPFISRAMGSNSLEMAERSPIA